jgi:hypothetical protein
VAQCVKANVERIGSDRDSATSGVGDRGRSADLVQLTKREKARTKKLVFAVGAAATGGISPREQGAWWAEQADRFGRENVDEFVVAEVKAAKQEAARQNDLNDPPIEPSVAVEVVARSRQIDALVLPTTEVRDPLLFWAAAPDDGGGGGGGSNGDRLINRECSSVVLDTRGDGLYDTVRVGVGNNDDSGESNHGIHDVVGEIVFSVEEVLNLSHGQLGAVVVPVSPSSVASSIPVVQATHVVAPDHASPRANFPIGQGHSENRAEKERKGDPVAFAKGDKVVIKSSGLSAKVLKMAKNAAGSAVVLVRLDINGQIQPIRAHDIE